MVQSVPSYWNGSSLHWLHLVIKGNSLKTLATLPMDPWCSRSWKEHTYTHQIRTRQHGFCSAQEQTGSSYSGLHFSHYIVVSYCPDLSLLHAAKLSICARNGVTLARWGMGLTVLLEKILGNVFINKLHAICLLEADFNWSKKLIFAWRMMQ
jgi:hypothetical protein